MSNDVYPALPGLKPLVRRRPEWKTSLKEALNGQETGIARRNWPRWIYTLSYEVLRSEAALPERAQLMAFFNSHRGAFDDFLYQDEEDHAVTDQLFGTTDGSATAFQLMRALDDWLEPVWAPAAGAVIKRAGSTLSAGSDYTLGATGQIVLAAPGSAGQALTWTGGYYMRVRFMRDALDFERFLHGLWQVGTVELYSRVYA